MNTKMESNDTELTLDLESKIPLQTMFQSSKFLQGKYDEKTLLIPKK